MPVHSSELSTKIVRSGSRFQRLFWRGAVGVAVSARAAHRSRAATRVAKVAWDCVVAVCGLLGTPILLGLFRMKEAQLSAGGRYSDWRFRARHLAVVLTSFGWFIGLLNVFFVAKEWSR